MTTGPIPDNSLSSQPCLVDSLYLEFSQQELLAHPRQKKKQLKNYKFSVWTDLGSDSKY